MKVAIIGAGLAGLCCAHELERHGITPVIYERNGFIGEPYPHVTVVVNVSHRPIKDSLEYYRSMNIDVAPLYKINKLVHNSPNRTMVVTGNNLGYSFLYTKDKESFKYQVYSKLKKTEVLLNKPGDYRELMKVYDHVVIATGTYNYPQELGIWQPWLKAFARGALVLGDFDPSSVVMWINKDYCKNGYAYMSFYSDKKASIVLVVPDVNENEIDRYWELFLYTEELKYTIVEEFKVDHNSGYAYPRIVDNLIFVGNAGGGVDPFLGFGHLNAVTMGVAAARTIAEGKDYEKQIKSLMDKNLQMRELRKAFNKLNNNHYDKLLAFMGAPGIKNIIYHSPLNVAQVGSIMSNLLFKKGSTK